jgi:NADH:ubiquinone oxidoreductase subunit H
MPFLGALRSAAQMVSYEVSIGFIIVTIVICCGSFGFATNYTSFSRKYIGSYLSFFPLLCFHPRR